MAIQADIIKGIYFQVGGEAGRTNGLAWHIMEEMGYHLQELIHMLAKYDLNIEGSPRLQEFEIEIYDFRPGSAVPAFRLNPLQKLPFKEVIVQKEIIAKKLDNLLSIADTGQYERFFDLYVLPEVKRDIAEEFYDFTLSADNSPIAVVEQPVLQEPPVKIYNIHRFNRQQTDNLLKPRTRRAKAETHEMLGLIRTVGSRRKIVDIYDGKETVVSVSLPIIVTLEKVYRFHSPLLCKVVKEDDHFIIEHDMLDIYSSGKTIDEAELDFAREFDASYNWFVSTPDDQLSERLIRAKNLMLSYIKE